MTEFPDHDADLCVMCGLCLPHCPTYQLTSDENESPRGRIALIRAVTRGKIPPTPKLLGHLDRCLTCRACESVCPSLVPYGKLIDSVRSKFYTHQSIKKKISKYFIHRWAIPYPTVLRNLGRLARIAQIIKADKLLHFLGLKSLIALIPKLPALHSWQAFYTAQGVEQGKVALFKGCVADIIEQSLLLDSVQLLNQLGYSVYMPKNQVCCGALAKHDGKAEQALSLALQNTEAFKDFTIEKIICTASGCATSLIEYPQWAGKAQEETRININKFSAKIRDINQFLFEINWASRVKIKPLTKRIAIHEPCSLRNTLNQQGVIHNLLKHIPNAEIFSLPNNHRCCGAAGSYMITQPEIAQTLREDKINSLKKMSPDILVTANIGCSLYLSAGIKAANLPIEIVHPAQLLARQISLQ
ncbi:(Fe-S)-binding protein [Candidatus Nitrosacidococcus sp. I8]|uniref:(Fe-S)-binding protein n=1 Tax=Candidatus Nitrosacidococcus sp. I8 TaxID=2942908 RepID=UPI002227CC16|nr:heterodisulfide reductase-related iron-sulfur binding cluster [Candidatus Nitrosacidococcus sp. I8]